MERNARGQCEHGIAMQAVLIAGPTASGKSALALKLAEKLGGTVINADSMQVYRDLPIITARPSPDEEARVPHRLYGHVDAAENYSVGRWCADVGAALAEAERAGRLPIVAGGTGLYFKALTQGLAAVPPTPPDVRASVRARLEALGPEGLYAELCKRDRVMAERLKPADRTRVSRALEVLEATGRSLAEWQREGMRAILDPARASKIFLNPDRAALHMRIDARFDAMLEAGALDEVRALERRGLDPLLPAMKAHGVPWLIRHLHGEISLDQAAAAAKLETRQYTKRQATWFRHQMPGWTWVAPEEAEGVAFEAVSAVRA
jgi:tRNA dimethylallyltransferase